MTRGRAPNLALPLTKALAQQRDYRARKAANIARLEKENDTLRNENDQLAKELAILRDVHHRGHADTRTATPSSSSAEANIQAQADYQHLRASYHALEAEVRRKEHVLHVLREKEREAFARLEGLMKQSMQVMDSATVPKEMLTGQHHGRTVKDELLQTVSDMVSEPHPDVYRPRSVDSSARSLSSREAPSHYPIDPRLPAVTYPARAISPSITRAHSEISAAPNLDPYRSRKRIRSSPGSSFGPAAVSQHPINSQAGHVVPITSASTYISHLPQTAGQSLAEHASRTSYAPQLPFHPRPVAIRELAPPRIPPYAMASASFSTHSTIVSDSPGPGALRDGYPPHILPLSTPPPTSYFREDELRPPTSFVESDTRFTEARDRASSMHSDTAYHRRESWTQDRQYLVRTPHLQEGSRPAASLTPDRRESGYPSTRATVPLLEASRDSPRQDGSVTSAFTAVSSKESRGCGSTSACIPSRCQPAEKVHCETTRSKSFAAPAQIATPPMPEDAQALGQEAALVPEADCCNGLFDCSALPPSLWMPLHAMSTSYERGNQPSKVASEAVEVRELAVDLRQSESSRRSSLMARVHDNDTVISRAESEATGAREAMKEEIAVKDADSECCFGILRCEEGPAA